jgi:hypothetical protein
VVHKRRRCNMAWPSVPASDQNRQSYLAWARPAKDASWLARDGSTPLHRCAGAEHWHRAPARSLPWLHPGRGRCDGRANQHPCSLRTGTPQSGQVAPIWPRRTQRSPFVRAHVCQQSFLTWSWRNGWVLRAAKTRLLSSAASTPSMALKTKSSTVWPSGMLSRGRYARANGKTEVRIRLLGPDCEKSATAEA